MCAFSGSQIGLRNWEYTEVVSGLKEGDRVVTTVDREGLADGVAAKAAAPMIVAAPGCRP